MSAGPIAETFDFWPFDIPPGTEFLLVYAVIALVGIILAKVVQVGLLSMLGPDVAEREAPTGYRSAASRGPNLKVGAYPSIDDAPAIALLRGGERALGEAILVQAAAEGWLRMGQSQGQIVLYPLPNDAANTSRALAANLHATSASSTQLRDAAARVAANRSADLERELVELGMLHRGSARAYALLAFSGVCAAVLGIGVVRAMRGLELGRPVGFLLVEVLVVGVVALLIARPGRLTDKGTSYLKWLNDSTHSLRQDVISGRTQRPTDLALAGALTGIVAVPAVAAMWAWGGGLASGSDPSWMTASSAGSTSCSSSSCGGGGGCGSSGCGGGGGCGG